MAKKTLSREGIHSNIVSIDPSLTKNGCGWGLTFNCGDSFAVRRILNKARISYNLLSGDY